MRAAVFLAAIAICVSCNDRSSKSQDGVANASSAGGPDASGASEPHRIVSLSPSTTETLYAIGAGGAVVGRSRYCDYPEDVKSLPQVGGYVDPNLEAILALKPDLVTGARGPAGRKLVDTLEARGIATYFPATESFAEIDTMIAELGTRTHHADRARATLDAMHAKIAAVETSAKTKPRVRALLVFGLGPVVVAGPDGFPNEMLARVNADNAVTKGGGYPTLSFETVIALDPDVVVNAAIAESHGGQPIRPDAPGWSSVGAIKKGHVAAITDESVLRPGPRIGDGLEVLSRAVHGGS